MLGTNWLFSKRGGNQSDSLTLSGLNLSLSSSSTTSRELLSQFATLVDEDDLKWMANEKNILLLLNSSMETLALQPLDFRKLNHSSEMQHDSLMHREGLKGYLRQDGYILFDLVGCPSTYLEKS